MAQEPVKLSPVIYICLGLLCGTLLGISQKLSDILTLLKAGR